MGVQSYLRAKLSGLARAVEAEPAPYQPDDGPADDAPVEAIAQPPRIDEIIQASFKRHLVLSPLLDEMLDDAPWCIDEVVLPDSREMLEIRGWAIAPYKEYSPVTFTVNGSEFAEIDYPILRDEIAQIFWYRPNARWSQFSCRTPMTLDELYSAGPARFSFCDKRSLQPFRVEHSIYYIDPRADELPFPDEARRERVHGNRRAQSFRIEGSSAFVKLEQALETVCGKRYDDFSRILDWGSGCGRVSRYFHSREKVRLVGIDVDADNVEWCKENLGFAEFEPIRLHPPTGLASSSFDLLIGISVFTHLREDDHLAWLEELARIATDGAILLMTIHGDSNLCRIPVDLDLIAHVKQSGFMVLGQNRGLDGMISESDYYTDTIITHDYVRDRWSKHFEILELIPSFIGNMQDLVVMQKRLAR